MSLHGLSLSSRPPPPCVRAQGASFTTTVLVTPLFFGAAHTHHLHDMVHNQGVPPGRAVTMVRTGELLGTASGGAGWLEGWLVG